jgi:hypothetical protein
VCASVHALMVVDEKYLPFAGRFNERLVLSLASCKACILMDDELNILPTSTHVREIREVEMGPDGQPLLPTADVAAARDLRDLADTLADSQVLPTGPRCVSKLLYLNWIGKVLDRVLRTAGSEECANCIVLWRVWPPRTMKCNYSIKEPRPAPIGVCGHGGRK